MLKPETAGPPDPDAILPTHTCFDDALELIGALRDFRARLVHAIVEPEGAPGPFAHAWVEREGAALWFGIYRGSRRLFATPADQYRAEFCARDVTVYTPPEAARMNAYHVTYGLWETRYLELCRKPQEKEIPT
jgi:hypothetical protein